MRFDSGQRNLFIWSSLFHQLVFYCPYGYARGLRHLQCLVRQNELSAIGYYVKCFDCHRYSGQDFFSLFKSDHLAVDKATLLV